MILGHCALRFFFQPAPLAEQLIHPRILSMPASELWIAQQPPLRNSASCGTVHFAATDWAFDASLSSRHSVDFAMSSLQYDAALLEAWKPFDNQIATSTEFSISSDWDFSSSNSLFGQLPLADLYYRRGSSLTHQATSGRTLQIYALKIVVTTSGAKVKGCLIWALDSQRVCFARTWLPMMGNDSHSQTKFEELIRDIDSRDRRRGQVASQGHRRQRPHSLEATATVDELMGVVQLRPRAENLEVLQLHLSDCWDCELRAPSLPKHPFPGINA